MIPFQAALPQRERGFLYFPLVRTSPFPKGFTLIEILVVLTVMIVLAGLAVPSMLAVREQGKQLQDLANAKQIYGALKRFADDNDGKFPWGPYDPVTGGPAATSKPLANSNEAFRNLYYLNYLTTEKIFYVAGSGWTRNEPDEKTDGAHALAPGECAYAYCPGLSDASNPRLPILADAFSTTVGTYAKDPAGSKGAIWKGKVAIVVRADGSSKVERCTPSCQVMEPASGGTLRNIFQQSETWLPQAPVNPAE